MNTSVGVILQVLDAAFLTPSDGKDQQLSVALQLWQPSLLFDDTVLGTNISDVVFCLLGTDRCAKDSVIKKKVESRRTLN